MEETKWLTKGKIITIVVIILAIGATVAGILIHKNNVKKDYAKFEKQLEYAAPNYLLKEKIKLKEYEWREINITDILKQKLVINKKSSNCDGYVIAEALKDNTIDLEEQTNPDLSESDSQDSKIAKEDEGKISTNITYKAYITCKKIYTTKGYGTKPDSNKKNTEETQTQNDTEKPSIELFGDATININVGDSYNELGAVAMDNVDGDITNKIKISGKVDTTKAGEYTIKYTVQDKAGNKSSVERKVVVNEKKEETPIETPSEEPSDNNNNNNNNNTNVPTIDTTSPIITFNDNSLYQTICAGNSVNTSTTGPYGFVARDNVDGIITSRVNISGDTDVINTPGVYTIYYSVSDNAGNYAEATKQFTVKNCGNTLPDTSTTIQISSLRITPNNRTINISQTVQINVTIYPGNATNKTISYSSSNPSVATISSNGVVTGMSSGTTIITATSSNGKTAKCTIKVN